MLHSEHITDMVPDEISNLYLSSFSDTEKIPLENIQRAMRGGGELIRYSDEGRFIGFTFSFVSDDKAFLIYFATVPEVRSKGYGKEILSILTDRYNDKISFLVAEPLDESADDICMRRRRHEYYKRNGMRLAEFTVISDDYPFNVFFMNGELSEKETAGFVRYYEDVHNGITGSE